MNTSFLVSRQRVSTLLAVLGLLILSLSLAVAQETTGRIVGVVTDPSGSVIPNAKVTVTNVATNISSETVTAQDGSYQVLSLQIGSYKVSVEATGFRKTVTDAQKLEINASIKIDVKLEVGATTETVQVEANASGVETVNAMIANSVTANQIVSLPLNGRNVMSLATLMPGVVPNTQYSTAGGTAFSVAGARPDSVTFMLDGGNNNNLLNNGLVLNPNPDAVEEFKILTSNFAPEFGRNAGVVSVVTKSGTNDFHGSAYDYLRNGDLNANTFFNNEFGLQRDTLKRNQFGATIGGPVLLPKFNGRNRLFFFVGYQGQRQTDLQTAAKTQVFTPAEIKGDFSHSNATGTGPDPGVAAFLQKFPYFQPNPGLAAQGIIDPTKIASVANNYVSKGLLATAPTGFLSSQGSATNNADELTEKVDFMATQNDRISVTLGSSRNPSLNPFATANIPGYPDDTFLNHYYGGVTYTKTISANLLNEFRFTAQRNRGLQAVPATKLSNPTDLGIKITSDDPTGPPILGFSASGMTAGFSPQGPTSLIDNTYNWTDTITWTKGKHNFKGGFNYTPYQNNTTYDFYVNGEFFFRTSGAASDPYTSNDRANFLLGLPDEYEQFPKAPSNIRSHNLGGYFQDEWRVMRNLTITLGLRYEYSSPKLDTQGRSFSLKYGQQSTVFTNAPLGLLFPGDPGAPVGSNFPDQNDWAPRFGFAWDPKGDGKTSIRGGFGIFYDILKAEDNLQFNGQAPFFGFADLFFNPLSGNPTAPPNGLSDPFGAAGAPNPFPSAPPPHNLNFANAGFLPIGGGGVYFVDPNLRTPYIYEYNLSIQREIMHNTTLSAAYIGSSSHKLTGLLDANPFILGTKTRLLNGQPGIASASSFSYLDEFANVADAHYNSLALGLTKRLSDTKFFGNLDYQLSYTYGHSIDNASGFRSRDSRVPTYNWGQFVGTSDFDVEHYISFAATWELPFAKAWSSGPKRLTHGWTLYPIVSYRSGLPLDVLAGLSRSRTTPGTSGAGDPELVRANLVSPINFPNIEAFTTATNGRTGNYYFDPAAFDRSALVALNSSGAAVTNPALRTYGTLGRNAFRAPDWTNVNLTIGKVTDLTERMKLDIRADFFNALNHPLFAAPNTSITGGTFGQITSTGTTTDPQPRIIQLSARIWF